MINEGADHLLENFTQESVVGSGLIKLKCNSCLQSADVVNQNKRVYSRAICEHFVDSAKEKIARGGLLQELNHPMIDESNSTMALKRQMSIFYDRCCSKINEIHMESNLVVGEIEFLSNSLGQDMSKMIMFDNIIPGVSCRALGKTKPATRYGAGIQEVVNPSVLVTFDIVSDPSHVEARMKNVTEVLQNPKSCKQLTEGLDGFALSEASTIVALRDLFLSDSTPFNYLMENFIYNDRPMNPKHEKKIIKTSMDSLFNQFINEDCGVLQESNVKQFGNALAHEHRAINTKKDLVARMKKYLNV